MAFVTDCDNSMTSFFHPKVELFIAFPNVFLLLRLSPHSLGLCSGTQEPPDKSDNGEAKPEASHSH